MGFVIGRDMLAHKSLVMIYSIVGNAVAHWEMRWLIGGYAVDHWRRCVGLFEEMRWIIGGYAVAHWRRCSGSLEKMRWLIGEDALNHWRRCGDSLEKMRWLIGEDAVALWKIKLIELYELTLGNPYPCIKFTATMFCGSAQIFRPHFRTIT